MRLIGRHDLVLLVGLTVALLVIFSRVPDRLLDVIRDLEESSGLRLLPALLILATVFTFHQYRKRQKMRAETVVASATARQAIERATEMERLVAFGQALAQSLDEESIRAAAAAHIPQLATGRGVWVMVRTGTRWNPLMAVSYVSLAELERMACAALGETDMAVGAVSRDTCFPMIVAGGPVGVLGVEGTAALPDEQRRSLTAAAALLAVSLKNAEMFRDATENSVRDALTGCFTRRHALELLDVELRRSRRSHMPLSMVMFDLDHFKDINDRYGHLAGDAVLAGVGTLMKSVLRSSDVKCRFGGEEFLIVLPDTPLSGAQRVAETLRRRLEERSILWNNQSIQATASFGVTTIAPGDVDRLAIMARADGALYRAKKEGRNCVQVTEEDTVTSH